MLAATAVAATLLALGGSGVAHAEWDPETAPPCMDGFDQPGCPRAPKKNVTMDVIHNYERFGSNFLFDFWAKIDRAELTSQDADDVAKALDYTFCGVSPTDGRAAFCF